VYMYVYMDMYIYVFVDLAKFDRPAKPT